MKIIITPEQQAQLDAAHAERVASLPEGRVSVRFVDSRAAWQVYKGRKRIDIATHDTPDGALDLYSSLYTDDEPSLAAFVSLREARAWNDTYEKFTHIVDLLNASANDRNIDARVDALEYLLEARLAAWDGEKK
jgi:hypothetical protein